jgi:hypothetical protein
VGSSRGQQRGRPSRIGPELRLPWWRGEDLNLRPSGYETYPFCLTGFYGLIEFVRFGSLPGEMGCHPSRPGKRPMTSKLNPWDFRGIPRTFGQSSGHFPRLHRRSPDASIVRLRVRDGRRYRGTEAPGVHCEWAAVTSRRLTQPPYGSPSIGSPVVAGGLTTWRGHMS